LLDTQQDVCLGRDSGRTVLSRPDPITAAARKIEAAIPVDPAAYRGMLKARARPTGRAMARSRCRFPGPEAITSPRTRPRTLTGDGG